MKLNLRPISAAGLALVLGACAISELPTSTRDGAVAELVGDRHNEFNLVPGVVNVCAFFGDDVGPTATFRASAPAGENVQAGDFSITPLPHCFEVWNASGSSTVPVTGSLVAVNTVGWELDRIVTAQGDGVADATYENLFGVSTATLSVSNTVGGYIWFKFRKVEVPVGGQGCTPGYWRQAHHYDSWTSPYTPSTPFSAVFANAFPGMTLGQVVQLGGGGLNALGRSAVASLLNAASPNVNFDYSTMQVINAFNSAFATGNKKLFEQQKDVLDFLNNQGCPLN